MNLRYYAAEEEKEDKLLHHFVALNEPVEKIMIVRLIIITNQEE